MEEGADMQTRVQVLEIISKGFNVYFLMFEIRVKLFRTARRFYHNYMYSCSFASVIKI